MLSVDTNVVIRYLTNDDPEQSAQARKLISNNDVFVCTTVLLETDWVLRTSYFLASKPRLEVLRGFAGLPRVTLENTDIAMRAFAWVEGGLDFADALHLASAQSSDAFVSFDRKLVRAARKLQALPVREPSQA